MFNLVYYPYTTNEHKLSKRNQICNQLNINYKLSIIQTKRAILIKKSNSIFSPSIHPSSSLYKISTSDHQTTHTNTHHKKHAHIRLTTFCYNFLEQAAKTDL